MTQAQIKRAAADYERRSRKEQGLPVVITDLMFVSQMASLLGMEDGA